MSASACLLLGFGCGIAVVFLILKLQEVKNKNFSSGDEEVCKNCSYKKTVIDVISEDDEEA